MLANSATYEIWKTIIAITILCDFIDTLACKHLL